MRPFAALVADVAAAVALAFTFATATATATATASAVAKIKINFCNYTPRREWTKQKQAIGGGREGATR